MENKYTKDQIVNFNESDWNFRRSSGYAGYDHKDSPRDEQKWIYQEEFQERKRLKEQYESEYKLISDFRRDCLPFGEHPEYVIQGFLDKRLFKNG